MSHFLVFLLTLSSNASSSGCVDSDAGASIKVSLSLARQTVAFGEPISATVIIRVLAPQVTLEHSDAGKYEVEAYDATNGDKVHTPLKTISMINANTYFQGDEITDTVDLNKMAIIPGPGRYAFRIDRVTKSGTCYRSNEIYVNIVRTN